ncbi:MAG TPA: Hsp20/alpha crystallin family protein [Candidatus Nitrosocosmicus sp.]|nr:Hsp20/alpha crystallin family protein [Candidatus Nitrosocosmicus sp.]
MEITILRSFAGLENFNFQFNQLFDLTLGRARSSASSVGTVWYPAVDVLESKDSYLLRAELPGMNKEYFNLEVKNGMLMVSGERKVEEPVSGVQYRSVERVAGKFSRSFYLPQTVQQDGIQATYRDGILEIYVPKMEHAKARQITVS